MNALLIGCGNIGAFYDWDIDSVKTYAKAFSILGIKFSVYDPNGPSSLAVAQRYGARVLRDWDEDPIADYDMIVVSSPTNTHFNYLTCLLENPPRLIICEKPVDVNPSRLSQLEAKYLQNSTRVMVNFYRRFQPAIKKLSNLVCVLQEKNPCQTVVIRYQRGFHNNSSHAIDLLSFLFGKSFDPSDVAVLNSVHDEFMDDATMTISCRWNGMQVLFVGLVHSKFSHFEVSIYFPEHLIELREGGNLVEIFSTSSRTGEYYSALTLDEEWRGVLDNHMLNVVVHAQKMLVDKSLPDNFMDSIHISKTIASIIGKKSNE